MIVKSKINFNFYNLVSADKILVIVIFKYVKNYLTIHVFKGIRNNADPLRRIEKFIENDMLDYLGTDVFEGGCFFLNMLVELSGQSAAMSKQILRGFVRLSGLLRSWLEEADQKGMLQENLDLKEVSNFIIISLNGAAALYISSRDRNILDQTVQQLRFYISQLKVHS